MIKIKIETTDGNVIEAEIIDTVKLNKIARNSCQGLTYLMNVMDSETTNCYMWFKDDRTGTNYLVELE